MRQASLFREPDPRSAKMKQAMDALNHAHGHNTIYLASAGIQHRWTALFENKTPHYTTRWTDLPQTT